MAKLGTVFVELSLDDKIYKQKLSENLTSTEATAKGIETSWKTLGTRSDAVFDAQRRSYENALTLIKNSTTSTTQDIIRAEEAKNAKLKQLNEQQYGSHKTLMQQITDSTTAHFSAAIIGSQMVMRAVDMIGSAITGAFSKGFNAVEEYNLSVASMAAMVVTFTERAKGMTFAEHWKEALEYSQGIVPVLENIAAKTLLSGQETTALANAFARAGVFLDANNQKQIESFTRISNALPVMTKGQEIMKQINSEIRAVMTGSQESTSMMLQTLKAIDPEIEKHLKAWRAEGTVLENIGELLVGFGPATALLENQWQAVKSTIDTTVTQVLRGGMQGAYNEIISSTQEINKWLEENKDVIQSGIAVGWSIVSNTVSTVWNILAGFGPMLKDVGELVGIIAYGWGGVFAVLKPIGAFLGNSIALVYEMGKALGNIIVMSGALATGQLTLAKTTYEESKKNWDEIVRLSESNKTILTKGIGDAITGYEQQAKASQTTQDKIKRHLTGTAKVQKEVDKERATALKHANEQIEKDLNKLTLTVEEQIQEQADKYIKLGVDRTRVEKWTTAQLEEINRKEADRILKIQQDANERIAQDRRKGTEDYQKLLADEADFAMNENERAMAKITQQEQDKLWKINVLLQEETISWEQYELARTQITANAAANRLEKEFNEAKRRADINYSAIQNIKGMEEEAYQMRIAQIDAEAAKRIKDGGDAVLLAKWVADEQQKAYIQMGKAGDDWAAGVQAALLELTRQHTTWGNTAYEVTKTFTDEAKTQLSDNFFNLFKGNINELGFDWDTMWDKMLQTLSKKIADMVIEAASHDILLMFKSEWVPGGSQVLGIVSKVLGFAGDLFNFDTGGYSTGGDWGTWGGTFGDYMEIPMSTGGRVPGSPSNIDSVHAMLAPGEFVIPSSLVSNLAEQGRGGDTMLAHINPAEAAILKMLGGSGTINPRTGLPEFSNGYPDNFYYNGKFGHFERIDPNDPANYLRKQWGDWRYVSPNPADPYQYFFSPVDYMNGAVANWSNAMPTASGTYYTGGEDTNWVMNPSAGTVTMNSQEGYNPPGGFLGQFGQYLAPALALAGAPFSGGMSLYAYAALMGGAAAGGNIAGQLIGSGNVNFEAALSQGFMTAGAAATGMSIMNLYTALMDTLATSGIAAGVEGNAMFVADAAAFAGTEGASADALAGFFAEAGELYPSTFAGSIYEQPWYSTALEMATSAAKKQLIKFALNQAFGAATGSGGDAGGYMQVSYEGAQDGGLLSSLAGIMSSMQGRGNFNVNPFSARDGLDYVPYDNFPINAHKGEAVLTAKENRERLSGGGGDANVTIHIENFYGDSDGINMLAQKVGDILDTYKRRGWRA